MSKTDIKRIQANPEDSKNAFFRGSLDHVYSLYRNRARDAGKTVLDLANFWHKFCLCFPNSGRLSGKQWPSDRWDDFVAYELGINVWLKSTDTALADKIDASGWFTAEGEAAVLDAFIQAQETLQNDDIMEDSAVGTVHGSVSDLHLAYLDKVREMGKTVLGFEDFWDRFRHRFPGSGKGNGSYYPELGDTEGSPVVFVNFRPSDTALASLIDERGWLERDEVLDAFIRDQETLSRKPYLEDSREPDFIDDTIPF